MDNLSWHVLVPYSYSIECFFVSSYSLNLFQLLLFYTVAFLTLILIFLADYLSYSHVFYTFFFRKFISLQVFPHFRNPLYHFWDCHSSYLYVVSTWPSFPQMFFKYRVTQKDVYPWKFQLWLWLKSYLFQITTTHYSVYGRPFTRVSTISVDF